MRQCEFAWRALSRLSPHFLSAKFWRACHSYSEKLPLLKNAQYSL
jgi:hypothetical protein